MSKTVSPSFLAKGKGRKVIWCIFYITTVDKKVWPEISAPCSLQRKIKVETNNSLTFLPVSSDSSEFHFSSTFSFLRFLLLTATIIAVILMTVIKQLHFYSSTWRISKLTQPIIIQGERIHLRTNCWGNSQAGCSETSTWDHSILHANGSPHPNKQKSGRQLRKYLLKII